VSHARKNWRLIAALLLAVLDDVLDLIDVAQPAESVADIVLALLIIWLLREKITLRNAAILLLDALPFVDMVPFWTLYVLYVIGQKKPPSDMRRNM